MRDGQRSTLDKGIPTLRVSLQRAPVCGATNLQRTGQVADSAIEQELLALLVSGAHSGGGDRTRGRTYTVGRVRAIALNSDP